MIQTGFDALLLISLTTGIVILALLALAPLARKHCGAGLRTAVWTLLALRLLIPVSVSIANPPFLLGAEGGSAPASAVFGEDSPSLRDSRAPSSGGQTAPPDDRPSSPGTQTVPPDGLTAAADSRPEPEPETPGLLSRITAAELAFLIWAAGAAAGASALFIRYFAFRRRALRWASAPSDPELLRSWEELPHGGIRLLVSREVSGPMLMGFFRPVLLLPDLPLPAGQTAFILRHELAHRQGGDLWLRLLWSLAVCVHWFNPLVWAMRRAACQDLEQRCDENVLRGAGEETRRRYGQTLLLSFGGRGASTALSTGFSESSRGMRRRLRNLLNLRIRRGGALLVTAALVLTLTLGLLTACAPAESSGAASASGSAEARLTARVRAGDYVSDSPAFTGILLDTDDPGLTPGDAVEVRLEELETPAAFNILQGVVYEIRFLRTEGPLLYALELRPSPDQAGAENAGDGQTPAPGPDENGPENAGTSATDGLWGELYGGLDDSLLPAHTAAGLDSERDEWLRRLENTENAVLRAGLPGAPGGVYGGARPDGTAGTSGQTDSGTNAFPDGMARKLLTILAEGLRAGAGGPNAGEQTWALAVYGVNGDLLWTAQYRDGWLTLALPDGEGQIFDAGPDCMNGITELLWQVSRSLSDDPEPGVAYRLLINDPQAYLRYIISARRAADDAALDTWENEWREKLRDESMTAVLYATTADGVFREGGTDTIRQVLALLPDVVAGIYPADPWDANGDPVLQLAAESASGSVLWSFTYNGEYVIFSPDGETGWCFRANEDVVGTLLGCFRTGGEAPAGDTGPSSGAGK